MSVKGSELADFISSTLNDMPDQYFEVAWDNQDYEASRIYQQERWQVDGGDQIERKVMLSNTGRAHYRRYYETDEPTVSDVMHTIKVDWTRLSTDYSWDDFELLRNIKNSAKGFINLLKERRIDGLWSLADLIEERFWKTPTNKTDDLYPYGIPYYINFLTSGSHTAGFNGMTIYYQDGTNDTTCANIDAGLTGESKWRNYAAEYTEVNNAMLKTFRKAFWSVKFKAPIFINDPGQKRNAQKRVYSDIDVCCDLMDLADAKDDRHSGKEVFGKMLVDDGAMVYINRLPVVPIPQLDGYTTPAGDAIAPIYCVDFKYIIPFVHDGYWMKESEPMTSKGQHTTFTVFLDGAHQNLCTNRRRLGFVLHKSH